jgi:replicative DNA helicase
MPSVGKSALTAEILSNCLKGGMKVGLFGLEDATKWVAKRLLARRVGMSVRDVGSGRLNGFQQEQLQEQSGELANLLRNLTVYRRAGISAPDLVARAKHWVLNLGVRLVVIDHGGEVQHEGGGRERNDLAVAATYRQLRDLAVNHRVPVVVLSHYNREVDKTLGGRPRLSSFAETEYIARMARLALGLWERPGEADHLRVTVLKQTRWSTASMARWSTSTPRPARTPSASAGPRKSGARPRCRRPTGGSEHERRKGVA